MKFLLIACRHTHPAIRNIPSFFDEVESEQIFDFDLHKKIIHKHLAALPPNTAVHLYVTGLTPLLISAVNYCRLFNINLTLYHYNTATNTYVAQAIV